MSDCASRGLNQKAVYWGNPQDTGRGEFTFDEAVEISCHWEDVVLVDPGAVATAVNLRSEVILAQDVEEQGMIKLCTLDSLDSDELSDPVAAGAYTIARFDKVPNRTSKKFFRKAYVGIPWTGKA